MEGSQILTKERRCIGNWKAVRASVTMDDVSRWRLVFTHTPARVRGTTFELFRGGEGVVVRGVPMTRNCVPTS